MEKITKWIVKNWNKIPDKFKTDISQGQSNISKDDSLVVLLLDRQKPSIERCYDYDEERIGVTREGKIIWGFDSGCSCPMPFEEHDNCYSCSRDYKTFILEAKGFDEDWFKECENNFEEIKSKTNV